LESFFERKLPLVRAFLLPPQVPAGLPALQDVALEGLAEKFWRKNGAGGGGVLDGSGWYVDMILVGGSEHFLFFHILGIIIPTD